MAVGKAWLEEQLALTFAVPCYGRETTLRSNIMESKRQWESAVAGIGRAVTKDSTVCGPINGLANDLLAQFDFIGEI